MPKKPTPPAKNNHEKNKVRRVVDLAAKLAQDGISSRMYEKYTSGELADYCLDVAERVFAYGTDDDEDE